MNKKGGAKSIYAFFSAAGFLGLAVYKMYEYGDIFNLISLFFIISAIAFTIMGFFLKKGVERSYKK